MYEGHDENIVGQCPYRYEDYGCMFIGRSLHFYGLHFFAVPVVACCCAQFNFMQAVFFYGLVKACFCAFFQAFIRPCIAITSRGSTMVPRYHSKVVYFGQESKPIWPELVDANFRSSHVSEM